MNNKLAWGIIGAGGIARSFANGVAQCDHGYVLAVGSRALESADKFADEFSIERRYASYQALLDDPDVQAVYIATPHPMHAEWAIKAARCGKHILCEKPITVNQPEAVAVVEACKENKVFLMEAFMYRSHPQTAKLAQLVRSGAIGKVGTISAVFSFKAAFLPEKRWLNPDLAGGGILDIGCYCTSMSRLIAGAAMGKTFADPVSVKALGYIGEADTDEYTSALLGFEENIIASVSCGVGLGQDSVVKVFGSEGSISVPDPWMCGQGSGESQIIVTRNDQEKPEIHTFKSEKSLYSHEADEVAKCVFEGRTSSDKMSPQDTLGNMKTLDRWRLEIGMIYPREKPDAYYPTITNAPLSIRADAAMTYCNVAGLDKKVSRIAMGVMMDQADLLLPHMSIMFDGYFESGGNAFDTAYIYTDADKILGQWMANRGVRDQVVVIGKGAHTPYCNPEDLSRQLGESLDNLQSDYIDIYFMHRDNEEVPVEEFVDVLNEHHRAGRIRAFGGSNWTLARVEAANRYAKSKGLVGFSAVSNNLTLAEMINPVWEGCLASGDPQSKAWFVEQQIPLFAWSSQARGFFTRANPEDKSEQILVNSWYSENNFKRLERARKLAAEKGVEAINIAVAYVLCQPFMTVALVGPRTLSEWKSSEKALQVQLTPDEMKWLNLEID